jgi:hypothetical protein
MGGSDAGAIAADAACCASDLGTGVFRTGVFVRAAPEDPLDVPGLLVFLAM